VIVVVLELSCLAPLKNVIVLISLDLMRCDIDGIL